MNTHSFNVNLATEIGLERCIILQNMYYWHCSNECIESMQKEGRTWLFQSVKQFTDRFPYLGVKVIRNALIWLEENGYIISGNYNENKYDRTKWYSLTDITLEMFDPNFSKRKMDFPESQNDLPKRQMEKPKGRTYTNTVLNTIVNNKEIDTNVSIKKKNENEFELREKRFYESLAPFVSVYGKEMIRAFYDYWREPNKSKTKMKFELEKTWSLELRLNRWENMGAAKKNKTKHAAALNTGNDDDILRKFNESING